LLAVALFGAVAVGVFGTALDAAMAAMHIAPDLVHAMDAQASRLAGAAVPADIAVATRQALDAAIDISFLQAYRVVMLACAGLALASALCAGLTVGAKPKPRISAAPAATHPSSDSSA
jgi:hypothetical protein